jgi:hypothetical protein
MDSKADRLVRYIRSLEGFTIVDHVGCRYDHMGAAITGAVLQSGLSYAVVMPRVEHVMSFPDARTTSGYLRLLDNAGPKALLRWKSDVKPGRAVSLARFFRDNGVETEEDLARWLDDPAHITELKQLKGIGDKTVDYLRILAGIQACAVDRHIFSFLAGAGIKVKGYQEANAIVHEAAGILGVGVSYLDHSIWEYMSGKKARPGSGKKKKQ